MGNNKSNASGIIIAYLSIVLCVFFYFKDKVSLTILLLIIVFSFITCILISLLEKNFIKNQKIFFRFLSYILSYNQKNYIVEHKEIFYFLDSKNESKYTVKNVIKQTRNNNSFIYYEKVGFKRSCFSNSIVSYENAEEMINSHKIDPSYMEYCVRPKSALKNNGEWEMSIDIDNIKAVDNEKNYSYVKMTIREKIQRLDFHISMDSNQPIKKIMFVETDKYDKKVESYELSIQNEFNDSPKEYYVNIPYPRVGSTYKIIWEYSKIQIII